MNLLLCYAKLNILLKPLNENIFVAEEKAHRLLKAVMWAVVEWKVWAAVCLY